MIEKLKQGNYVAFDFETANNTRLSACSIGLVVYDNFEEVEAYHTLIQPIRPGFLYTYIHGISERDVMHAPTFEAITGILRDFMQDMPIVAHNMPFDYAVLKASFDYLDMAMPRSMRFCTLKASRAALRTPNHRLNTLADYFHIPLNHHEALSDARAAGLIARQLIPVLPLERFCLL